MEKGTVWVITKKHRVVESLPEQRRAVPQSKDSLVPHDLQATHIIYHSESPAPNSILHLHRIYIVGTHFRHIEFSRNVITVKTERRLDLTTI